MASNERLNHARWSLERQLAWIAAADAKVGVVVTLHLAMLGGLGAAYTAAITKTAWMHGSSLAYCGVALFSLIFSVLALWPRTRGPKKSMLYFGCIAEMTCEDYADAFQKKSDDDLLEDLAEQIHRNAEIARDKHKRVGQAMMVAFVGAIFWVGAVGLLVVK